MEAGRVAESRGKGRTGQGEGAARKADRASSHFYPRRRSRGGDSRYGNIPSRARRKFREVARAMSTRNRQARQGGEARTTRRRRGAFMIPVIGARGRPGCPPDRAVMGIPITETAFQSVPHAEPVRNRVRNRVIFLNFNYLQLINKRCSAVPQISIPTHKKNSLCDRPARRNISPCVDV